MALRVLALLVALAGAATEVLTSEAVNATVDSAVQHAALRWQTLQGKATPAPDSTRTTEITSTIAPPHSSTSRSNKAVAGTHRATETKTSTSAPTTATATVTETHTETTDTLTRTKTSTQTETATETTTTRSTTVTKTSTSTATATTTTASSTQTTSTITVTTTVTSTATTTATTTTGSTTTATTTTRTTTTATVTQTRSTTTTAYCFEEGVSWAPLNMDGVMPMSEVDEWACQRRCLATPRCSHFSFHSISGQCSLQDRFAVRQEGALGFMSGPFQCKAYILPGEFTEVDSHTYFPQRFHCMQLGVLWQPEMDVPVYLEGSREEVIFGCQRHCRDLDGCSHFTVVFPNACHVAGDTAAALPSGTSAISGPPVQDCTAPQSEADWAHTIMRKASLRTPSISSQRQSLPTAVAGLLGALVAASGVMALMAFRRGLSRDRRPPGARPLRSAVSAVE